MLDLCGCTGFSLVVVSGDCSLVLVLRLLIAVASLVGEHGLYSTGASVVSTHGLIVVAPRLRSRSSAVRAHRLGCSVAREMIRDQTHVCCISR